jgi:hypothetical protein
VDGRAACLVDLKMPKIEFDWKAFGVRRNDVFGKKNDDTPRYLKNCLWCFKNILDLYVIMSLKKRDQFSSHFMSVWDESGDIQDNRDICIKLGRFLNSFPDFILNWDPSTMGWIAQEAFGWTVCAILRSGSVSPCLQVCGVFFLMSLSRPVLIQRGERDVDKRAIMVQKHLLRKKMPPQAWIERQETERSREWATTSSALRSSVKGAVLSLLGGADFDDIASYEKSIGK